MSTKTLIFWGLLIGSTVGQLVPLLWGGGIFSVTAIIFSGIGALVGIGLAIVVGNWVSGG